MRAGFHHVAIALTVLVAGPARSQEPVPAGPLPQGEGPAPVEIRADRIVYDVRGASFEAAGSAELRRGSSRLGADVIRFDEPSGRGVAEGDVLLEDGPDTLRARRIELDVHSWEGVVFDGQLRSETTRFRADGARIERTGPHSYRVESGRFTTCNCPDDERQPWALVAEETDFEVEGYGTARDARFEVLGVPVAWLPWFFYPVKTQRQSGLLLPEVAVSGRNGVEIGLPLFLALGDPLNVTLTPSWLQNRGAKGNAEIEWVLGRESGGRLAGAFLVDQAVEPDSLAEPFGDERWTAFGRQDLHLPRGVRARTDFAFVSDNQYPTDFDEPFGARTYRYLESTAFVDRGFGATGAFGLVGSADFADDLQNPDDQDRDDFAMQRLPQLDAAWVPTRLPVLSQLVPALGIHYTWFNPLQSARSDRPDGVVVGDDLFLDTGIDSLPNAQELGPFGPRPPGPGTVDRNMDDFDAVARPGGTEGDGLFQEGEPLADAGHRVLLTPRLGMPLRLLDLFEVYPEVGWHQTLYGSDAQGFEERGLFTARADLRTRLRRRFAGAVHVLEPSLGYAFVSERGQGQKPLYVPATAVPQRRLRQLDLENRVLDPADRIEEVNALTLALGNRLYGRGGEAAGRLLADVTLSASYEAADGDFGGIYLDGHAHAWGQSDAWLILGLDPERGRLAEALVDFAWNFERGHRLGLGYRYLRDVGRFYEDFQFATPRFSDFKGEFDRVDQLLASARLVISDRWALTYQGGFSFEKSILLANRAGIEYTSRCDCWSIGIDVAQNRVSGVSIALSYSLKGLGRDDVARAARRRRDAPGFLEAW